MKSGTLEIVYCVHNKLENREFFYKYMYTQHILVNLKNDKKKKWRKNNCDLFFFTYTKDTNIKFSVVLMKIYAKKYWKAYTRSL